MAARRDSNWPAPGQSAAPVAPRAGLARPTRSLEPVPPVGFLQNQRKCAEVFPGRQLPRILGWHLPTAAAGPGIHAGPRKSNPTAEVGLPVRAACRSNRISRFFTASLSPQRSRYKVVELSSRHRASAPPGPPGRFGDHIPGRVTRRPRSHSRRPQFAPRFAIVSAAAAQIADRAFIP